MSGARAGAGDQGGRDHGLHGGLDPTAGLFDHDDVDSFFFHNRSPCATTGEGGGGGSFGVAGNRSITDYLQGFLADDGAVKQEIVGRHDDLLQMAGGAGAPITPNSSVLSSSSDAIGGEHHDDDEQAGSAADGNCKRSSNGEKKPGERKKARQPRVAFKTKSEVDHLEDGYRWRKYGQKAVKNSSYPRSYYRCTAARCGVKKLVERSQQDPSSVITTYEGQHTHPSPAGLARAGTARGLLLQHQPHNNGFLQHQFGFIRPDDLSPMAYYAHGMPSSSSPAAGNAMPPPPLMHLLRQDP